MLERPLTWWGVAALIALLWAITNLPWQLDDYDQAKQAFTSFEMVEEGNWFYQHTPNEKIATKPPLVGWISAALYAVTRSWEVAWRLPSLGAGVLLLVILARASSRVYGTTAALVAFSAFGLNLLSPRLATLVRTDMPLALVVFLLGLKIWEKVRSGEAWGRRDRWIMFALLTAAMLVKGPIVYAFLLPGIVVFQWWRRSAGAATGSAWCGWWPWVVSLVVFSAWGAAGLVFVPEFYEQVVLKEFAGRFSEKVHRPQPFYFYFPHMLHKFAPWSVLLIAVAVVALRAERLAPRERWQRLPPEVAWLLFWALGGLLVMSLIPSKRVDRIFPVVPPLCLLLAAQFRGAVIDAKVRRWAAIAVLFACVFTSGYAAHKVFTGYRDGRGGLVEFAAAVRARSERYEVIGGKEEGLLLYLRRTRFLKPREVAEQWNAGTLDAVVAPAEQLPQLLPLLPDAVESGVSGEIKINRQSRRYVLLTRKS